MRAIALPLAGAAVLSVFILAAADGAHATPVSSADSPVVFVPWKVLNPGDPPPQGVLVLYWLPASAEGVRHSDLLSDRTLAAWAGQCVSMQIVRSTDGPLIERLGATGKLPAAVLTDGADGRVMAMARGERALLRAGDVIGMVRSAIRAREDALNRDLDAAPKMLAHGDRDAAIALYRHVFEQRCLFPRHGREAERALRKLRAPLVVDTDAHR